MRLLLACSLIAVPRRDVWSENLYGVTAPTSSDLRGRDVGREQRGASKDGSCPLSDLNSQIEAFLDAAPSDVRRRRFFVRRRRQSQCGCRSRMFALPVECYVVAEGDDIDEKSYDDLQPQSRRFGRQ